MSTHTNKCPHCGEEIELPVRRWDTVEPCPKCNKAVYIRFDFIVMDDEEEWDLYEFRSEEWFK